MDRNVAQLVWSRAGACCEYCRISQQHDEPAFEIDHIIPRKHLGKTIAINLALSCFHCNRYKGSNLSGRDPVTRLTAPLFNPRRHKWERHFRSEGPLLVGRTPVGRATVATLRINDYLRVLLRKELIEENAVPIRKT